MKHFELKGEIRQAANKHALNEIRRAGRVPCNLYGCGMENILFTVDAKELKALTNTPKSHIVDLVLDGKTYMAVAHEYQWHPVDDNCLHVDFLAIDEAKPVAINVPLRLEGHPVGMQAGGKFTQLTRAIKISALLKDLPDDLFVDITPLQLGGRITVADLHYDNITILSPKTTIICRVKATRGMQAAAVETAE